MTGLQYFTKVLTTFNGRGRARRREYWYFVLFNGLFTYALMGILTLIFGWPQPNTEALINAHPQTFDEMLPLMGDIYLQYLTSPAMLGVMIWGLCTLVQSICLLVRRFHDIGGSGWWVLLCAVVPYIGSLALLIVALIEGQPRENKYGPDPKAEEHQPYAPYDSAQEEDEDEL